MPELIGLSRTAILYFRTSGSCVALAEALETVSHDRLTRMRQGAWSGHTRLEGACRTRLTWPGGFLLSDETVIPQPLATTIDGLAGVFSSAARKPVDGVSLVLLVWPHGVRRIPLGRRLWRPGGPSQIELALEWLR